MVVPGPGTYCFPLEVFETYKVRTYPQRLPLTFAYDDGFDDDDFEPSYAPRAATRSMTPEEELEYEISQIPCLSISPKMIPLDQAVGTQHDADSGINEHDERRLIYTRGLNSFTRRGTQKAHHWGIVRIFDSYPTSPLTSLIPQ